MTFMELLYSHIERGRTSKVTSCPISAELGLNWLSIKIILKSEIRGQHVQTNYSIFKTVLIMSKPSLMPSFSS